VALLIVRILVCVCVCVCEQVLLIAADVYRPAAIDQLQTLGERIEVRIVCVCICVCVWVCVSVPTGPLPCPCGIIMACAWLP
jgi:hypothetical protein